VPGKSCWIKIHCQKLTWVYLAAAWRLLLLLLLLLLLVLYADGSWRRVVVAVPLLQCHSFCDSCIIVLEVILPDVIITVVLITFVVVVAAHWHGEQVIKNRCALTEWGLSLGRNANLHWQPSGYALYSRPITIKLKLKCEQMHPWGS